MIAELNCPSDGSGAGGDAGGQPRGQPQGQDTERSPEDGDGSSGGGGATEGGGGGGLGLGTLYDGFVSFVHTFGDLRFSYRDDRRSSFSRVTARPDLLYQFGLGDFDRNLLNIPGSGTAGRLEDNAGKTYTSSFDTSWQPGGSFYVDFAWQESLAKTAVTGSQNQTYSTTFPDLSVNIEGLETKAFLKKVARTSALNTSYRRTIQRSGVITAEREGNWYDVESVSHDFTPLAAWRATWNNGINTTLTVDRSRSTDSRENRGVVSSTINNSNNIRLNGRYSFSAPRGISFLGKRLRFSSDLTLNLDISRGENKIEEQTTQSTGDSVTNVRSHTKTLGVTPRATYNFSRKLQGSLDISYSRSQDLQRGRKDTTISVALEALIQF